MANDRKKGIWKTKRKKRDDRCVYAPAVFDEYDFSRREQENLFRELS